MARIILITVGMLVVLLMLLCFYCALIVASREDDRMERYCRVQQMKAAEKQEREKNTEVKPDEGA